MPAPTVYLDTNVISTYWYEGADVLGLSRRAITRDWWDTERRNFEIWVSAVTEDELRAGVYSRQADCLRMVRRLKYLPITATAREMVARLLLKDVVPANKPGDAFQMAVCAIQGIDYLVSWNYAHLTNPVAQERLAAICRRLKLRVPSLVSPETIPRKSLGQEIRRPKS